MADKKSWWDLSTFDKIHGRGSEEKAKKMIDKAFYARMAEKYPMLTENQIKRMKNRLTDPESTQYVLDGVWEALRMSDKFRETGQPGNLPERVGTDYTDKQSTLDYDNNAYDERNTAYLENRDDFEGVRDAWTSKHGDILYNEELNNAQRQDEKDMRKIEQSGHGDMMQDVPGMNTTKRRRKYGITY